MSCNSVYGHQNLLPTLIRFSPDWKETFVQELCQMMSWHSSGWCFKPNCYGIVVVSIYSIQHGIVVLVVVILYLSCTIKHYSLRVCPPVENIVTREDEVHSMERNVICSLF